MRNELFILIGLRGKAGKAKEAHGVQVQFLVSQSPFQAVISQIEPLVSFKSRSTNQFYTIKLFKVLPLLNPVSAGSTAEADVGHKLLIPQAEEIWRKKNIEDVCVRGYESHPLIKMYTNANYLSMYKGL